MKQDNNFQIDALHMLNLFYLLKFKYVYFHMSIQKIEKLKLLTFIVKLTWCRPMDLYFFLAFLLNITI